MARSQRCIDLTGQTFGYLYVIERGPDQPVILSAARRKEGRKTPGHIVTWRCRCKKCGNEKIIRSAHLRRGQKSCGCASAESISQTKMENLTGQRFGKLTVIRRLPEARRRNPQWLCHCECGNDVVARSGNLKRYQRSCGCCPGSNRLPEGEACKRALLRQYKSAARGRGLEFSISDAEARNIFDASCFYCATPPARVVVHPEYNGRFIASGIDRVDNKKGYVPDNCVPCCGTCNLAKREMTVDEFLEWAHRLVNFQIKKRKWTTSVA